MPFFAKGDFTMGVFSEIAMEQQNSMFDSSAAFEDDEAFELEEMESLPVPPVGTDTVPVSAASVSAGETASADAEEEPVDEVASDGEEKSAEEGNSAQPPAAEDEEKKRAEHEAAEAQRKAEFDAKQQAKKAAEQEQIARLEAMSDEEVIAASTQRVSTDVEKLTRRNMKECVSEHIQMLCILLYNKVRSKVNSELDLLLDEGDVDAILMGKKTQYPDAAIWLTEQMAQEFINDLFSTLRERMLDLQYCKVVFVGGGAILLKRQIETSGKVGTPFFVPKINANADGYEYLYRIETAGR